MLVGFSTGSLALGDVRMGLHMVAGQPTKAVELSALREEELVPLIEALDSLDLSQFSYISVHAPSRIRTVSEETVVELLRTVAVRGWQIVVHPDVIQDFELWAQLGACLCIENMDKRKSTGRSARELQPFFDRLPDAGLCFDIAHARQVDPTMCEAALILRQYRDRIRQIHMSCVNSRSAHEQLNYQSVIAYRRVASLLPRDVPVILETPIRPEQFLAEIEYAKNVFE